MNSTTFYSNAEQTWKDARLVGIVLIQISHDFGLVDGICILYQSNKQWLRVRVCRVRWKR